ncbi:MAG: hypothetical protein ABI843_02395 [Dokdonella sp.]
MKTRNVVFLVYVAVMLSGISCLAAAVAEHATAPAAAAPIRPDVLVVEHTPIGVVERAGFLATWSYDGAHMLVEFVDDGDELFHNGFDPAQ